jgi:hypothetical protein
LTSTATPTPTTCTTQRSPRRHLENTAIIHLQEKQKRSFNTGTEKWKRSLDFKLLIEKPFCCWILCKIANCLGAQAQTWQSNRRHCSV